MQMCIFYELAPERAVEMPGAASDEARLNLTRNDKAEEWCGRWRPAAVRNARRLTESRIGPRFPYKRQASWPPSISHWQGNDAIG